LGFSPLLVVGTEGYLQEHHSFRHLELNPSLVVVLTMRSTPRKHHSIRHLELNPLFVVVMTMDGGEDVDEEEKGKVALWIFRRSIFLF
jgi:hypothetical protein